MLNEESTAEILEAVADVQIDSGEIDKSSESAGAADSLDATDATTVDDKVDDGVEAEAEPVVLAGTEDEEVEISERIAKANKAEARTAEAALRPLGSDIRGDLIERAVRAGLSLSDTRSIKDARSLEAICGVLEAKSAPTEEQEADPLDSLVALDPEVYEPEVIKMFDTLTNEIRSQREKLQAVQSANEQSAKTSNEASGREVVQWFDKQVENLGDDYVEALGKGTHNTLDQGSPQFAKREEIAEHISIMLAGYQATGRQVPPQDEIFKQATRTVLRDEISAMKEKKLKGDLGKRSKQHIARSSGPQGVGEEALSAADETAALIDAKYGN